MNAVYALNFSELRPSTQVGKLAVSYLIEFGNTYASVLQLLSNYVFVCRILIILMLFPCFWLFIASVTAAIAQVLRPRRSL